MTEQSIKVLGINHVAVAPKDPQKARWFFEKVLGVPFLGKELVASQKTQTTFVDIANDSKRYNHTQIEILENQPGTDGPVAKFLATKGGGIHHIAMQVDDIDQALLRMKSFHVQMIDDTLQIQKSDATQERDPANLAAEYGIIGTSPAILNVLSRVELIKNVDSTVLITGESGTGKELIARAIHNSSNGAKGRFEGINCGAIPANLLESELFGHKRGAFTDAKFDRKGIFEICSEGSLLLDEIGEMPHELQVKILRVLQEGEVTPLGSSKSIKVNTRVIAATNRNLEEEVRKGNFREDLYFRLAVLTINLPPLRERRSDIPLLINHFTNKICTKFNKQMQPLSRELEARLMAYDWPGNIRELQNAVERGVVLSPDGNFHLEDMLPPSKAATVSKNGAVDAFNSSDLLTKTLSEAKLDFEKEYLKQLLELTRGNISEIARISGRYRADVYRLLAKHEVEWQEFRH